MCIRSTKALFLLMLLLCEVARGLVASQNKTIECSRIAFVADFISLDTYSLNTPRNKFYRDRQ